MLRGQQQAEVLRARFDRIFKRSGTGYVMLDRLLRRLFRNKDGLLRVLDRPEIPLNTNASENDIRALVTKRKISGGTVSDKGRDTRHAGACQDLHEAQAVVLRLLGFTLGPAQPPNPAPRRSYPPRSILTPRPEISPGYHFAQ